MTLMSDFKKKFLTNDGLGLIGSPVPLRRGWLGHCFKAVTLPYLLLIRRFDVILELVLKFIEKDVHIDFNGKIVDKQKFRCLLFDDRFSTVVRILAYYARNRGFDFYYKHL
jgi:hypothetical protein